MKDLWDDFVDDPIGFGIGAFLILLALTMFASGVAGIIKIEAQVEAAKVAAPR